MKGVLRIVYDELPPTSNKIYFQGVRLTRHAREYAERFSYHVTRQYLHAISDLNKDAVYAVHLRFFFDELENTSFNNPSVAPHKRAKSRYKKIDLSNRIKLLEDCLRDFLGVDDSQTFAASQEKHQDPGHERVEIYVQEVDPELFGLRGPTPTPTLVKDPT